MDNKELLKAIRSIVKEEIEPVKEDIKGMKATQEEHTQILRALEERSKVTQAEVENLKHDLAETNGTVKGIERSVKSIAETQGILEDVTAHNWNEIRGIKKQVQ